MIIHDRNSERILEHFNTIAKIYNLTKDMTAYIVTDIIKTNQLLEKHNLEPSICKKLIKDRGDVFRRVTNPMATTQQHISNYTKAEEEPNIDMYMVLNDTVTLYKW